MLTQLSSQYGVLLVFASVLATTLGLPIPALPTVIVVAAGIATATATPQWSLLAVFFASLFASMIGDGVWYLLGGRYGLTTLKTLCRMSLSRDTCVRQTERFFIQWGVRVLAVAKFIPGLSMVAVPLAGAMRVPLRAFATYAVIGAALWAAVGVAVGALFARQLDGVLSFIAETGRDAALVAVVLVALYIAYRFWRRRMLLREIDAVRIDVDTLYEMMEAELTPLVLDVRTAHTRGFDGEMIRGAQVYERGADPATLKHVPRERAIVVYCACPNEVSAAQVAQRLRAAGFATVHVLRGGADAWRAAGYPMDAESLTQQAVGGAPRLASAGGAGG
ncbi:rhodanese-like domain-containing protein [Chitinasiproducens palmae]|nr:VTT domain-containing protein [Chitinasiproducens palmae]